MFKPIQHELREAKIFFRWAMLARVTMPELDNLFAIPNGGARDQITGARLKAEGVRPGVPDYMLAVATHAFNGLFLELKSKERTARPSAAQLEWHNKLRTQGYSVVVCRGFEDARNAVLNYLPSISHGKQKN